MVFSVKIDTIVDIMQNFTFPEKKFTFDPRDRYENSRNRTSFVKIGFFFNQSCKGTSINDVPQFSTIFDLPTSSVSRAGSHPGDPEAGPRRSRGRGRSGLTL